LSDESSIRLKEAIKLCTNANIVLRIKWQQTSYVNWYLPSKSKKEQWSLSEPVIEFKD